MDTIISLRSAATYEEDANGIRRPVKGEGREVFASVTSVSRSEFFQAGRAGFAPAFVFHVFAAEYDGESVIEYNDETYAVYRTYRKTDGDGSDYVELYAQREAGTDGQAGRT